MARATGFCLFDTAIGRCAIAWGADERIVGVQLPEHDERATGDRMRLRFPDVAETRPPPGVAAVVNRIIALLNGHRDPLLDVQLDMTGVPEFHQRVFEVARTIPPGRTMTYGDVAARLGKPGAARAVGQALGHNPFAPVVPCHRVLAAGSRGGGFSAAGGVATKLTMLEIERARLGSEPGLFDSNDEQAH